RGRYKTAEQGAESIRLLAAAGADINARGENGQTAVHAAVQKGWAPVLEALAELGADLTVADDRGITPLQLARGETGQRERFQAPAQGNPEIAALLERLIAGETAAIAGDEGSPS